MEKIKLGKTGLNVSRMSVGSDTMQKLSVKQGAELFVEAYEKGLNFWDTSDDYGSHPQVKDALKMVGRKNVIVTTKLFSRSAKQAEACLKRSLEELGTNYIDIILLHAVDSIEEFHARKGALDYLHKAKKEGLVKAVGLSTHNVEMAKHCANLDKIEVVLATINNTGYDVHDGAITEMKKALKKLYDLGKGIYAMKVLSRGNAKDIEKAMSYVKKLSFIHSLCIGVQNKKQLKEDIKIFETI